MSQFCPEADGAPAEKPCGIKNEKPTRDLTGVYTDIYRQMQRSRTWMGFPLSPMKEKATEELRMTPI